MPTRLRVNVDVANLCCNKGITPTTQCEEVKGLCPVAFLPIIVQYYSRGVDRVMSA